MHYKKKLFTRKLRREATKEEKKVVVKKIDFDLIIYYFIRC